MLFYKKRWGRFRCILAPLVAAGALLTIVGAALAAENVNDLNPLYQTLPAEKFTGVAWEYLKTGAQPLSRTRGVFLGQTGGAWQGSVIHLNTPGYGGPMDLLVAFDPGGRIIKVNVFRHSETDCHVTGMTKGNFLAQFIGVGLMTQIKLLVGLPARGEGEIQAMTGGTVTSKAVTEAVAEARAVFYQLFGAKEKWSPLYKLKNE